MYKAWKGKTKAYAYEQRIEKESRELISFLKCITFAHLKLFSYVSFANMVPSSTGQQHE